MAVASMPHIWFGRCGGDGSGMRLARNGCGLALGAPEVELPRMQAQDTSLGGPGRRRPSEPRPEFPVSFPA